MKAEIISVGTELLLGEIVNTDASYIAAQLPALGIDIYFITTVGDNKQRLIETLQKASERADIIIITGGLGPTQDDLTREAVSEFLKEPISIDRSIVKKIESLFSSRNIVMSPTNIKQASVIPSASTMENDFGTAPGWWIAKDNKIIITLPGPPNELINMWKSQVLPRLSSKDRPLIMSRTLKIFNLPESQVDELVSQYLNSTNPTLAIYAKPDGIHLRITAKAQGKDEAEKLIGQMEKNVRLVLNKNIWGVDSDTIENLIGKELIVKGFSLATVETETGGLLASTITRAEESSKYYWGGLVIARTEGNTSFNIDDQLIKHYGKISAEVTDVMAVKIRQLMKTNIGLAVSGVMNPETTRDENFGTVAISINYNGTMHNFIRKYPGQSFQIKQRAVTAALFELRKILMNGGENAPHN